MRTASVSSVSAEEDRLAVGGAVVSSGKSQGVVRMIVVMLWVVTLIFDLSETFLGNLFEYVICFGHQPPPNSTESLNSVGL